MRGGFKKVFHLFTDDLPDCGRDTSWQTHVEPANW